MHILPRFVFDFSFDWVDGRFGLFWSKKFRATRVPISVLLKFWWRILHANNLRLYFVIGPAEKIHGSHVWKFSSITSRPSKTRPALLRTWWTSRYMFLFYFYKLFIHKPAIVLRRTIFRSKHTIRLQSKSITFKLDSTNIRETRFSSFTIQSTIS